MANTMYTPDVGKVLYGTDQLATFVSRATAGTLKFGLYTANSAGSPYQTTYGTLTQPTFTGYALIVAANPVLGTLVANSQQPIQFDSITFQPTGAGSLPQTAIGWFVVYTTGNVLYNYQPFATSFVFTSTSSACTFTPVIGAGEICIP